MEVVGASDPADLEGPDKGFQLATKATQLERRPWLHAAIMDSHNFSDCLRTLGQYRPIGLANTLYKLWTRLVTCTMYEYAEAHQGLSTVQAGFRRERNTVHQLQLLVSALEDARLYQKNMYAILVD